MGPGAPAGAREAGDLVRFAVVDAERLKIHERTEPDLLRETVEAIRADGALRYPILVEDQHLVILDGHHRYEALRALGCRRIPVYLVRYDDSRVRVTTWPKAAVPHITKAMVVDHALRGDPFPPKTSRHRLPFQPPAVDTPLEDLR